MSRILRALRAPCRTIATAILRATVLVSAPAAGLLAAPPEAEAAEPPVIAVYIEGQDADSVRDEILSVVPGTVRVVDADTFNDALRKAGQKGQMGNAMAIARQRKGILAKVRKAADAVGATATIIGRIRKTRTLSREVYLLYLKSSGELQVDEPVPLDDSRDQRKSALQKTLGPPLAEIAPAETSTTDPNADPNANKDGQTGDGDPSEGDGDSAPDRTPNDVATAVLVADLSYQVGGRYFSYSDGLTPNVRPYDVFGAPMARIAVEFYPLALAKDIPIGKDIGLTGSYAMAFGLKSATKAGTPITNTWMRVGGGLRGRIRFGDAPSKILGISAGFHLLKFSFNTDDPIFQEVPDVSYKLLRLGLDTRLPFGPVALEIDGAFLVPVGTGTVYDRFRDASVLGIEGRAGLAIPLGAGFEVRVMGEYTRFFSAFAPVPGDPYVAGGALDQLIAARIGAAYAY